MNDKHRAAARSGVGAVMGSKNLKAIAALKETTISELLRILVGKEIEENAEECDLCRKFGREPNATTKKAMAEKGGKSFKSVKALMEDLLSD